MISPQVRRVRTVLLWGLAWLGCGEATGAVPEPIAAAVAPPAVVPPAAVAPRAPQVLQLEPVGVEGLSLPGPTVCIPAEAQDDPARTFPVLYAFDGDFYRERLGLCDQIARLTASGVIEPWVVVSVPSTAERDEVLTTRSEAMASLLLEVLEPAVQAHVSLRPGRGARALIGYSYGGLAALQVATHADDHFGRVVAMSPSVWFRSRRVLSEYRARARWPQRLYVDVGTREGDPREVIPYMVSDARSLVRTGLATGLVFGRELALREVPGDPHDMARAGPRLQSALAFGLSDVDLSQQRPESLALFELAPMRPGAVHTFSVNAEYQAGIVLSWPSTLAHAALDGRPLPDDRLPGRAGALSARVGDVHVP